MGKNILLGITGGIAAYKSANIISKFKKAGYNVKVIMTENASKIISKLAIETLARDTVVVDMWGERGHIEVEHISLATWADIVLIAPATYNIVGKIANGIADDMLSTVVSASTAPKYLALAMNDNMYNNPILKENINKLKSLDYNFIEADEGFLACNVNAKGRLKDEGEIVDIITKALDNKESSHEKLIGKKITITAGGTRESIDPVRFLGNNSTGKMGYALAETARDLGGDVTLITAPTNLPYPKGVNVISVTTGQEMYEASLKDFDNQDIFIGCAAVADYKIKEFSKEKIKKSSGDLTLTFTRNPDIIATLGKMKKGQFIVGFAAESSNLLENARGKLERKNLDLIVGNNVNYMGSSTNKAILIPKEGDIVEVDEMEKKDLGKVIFEEILKNIEKN